MGATQSQPPIAHHFQAYLVFCSTPFTMSWQQCVRWTQFIAATLTIVFFISTMIYCASGPSSAIATGGITAIVVSGTAANVVMNPNGETNRKHHWWFVFWLMLSIAIFFATASSWLWIPFTSVACLILGVNLVYACRQNDGFLKYTFWGSPPILDEKCVVCYNRTELRTPCGHILCYGCASRIRGRVRSCPICRQVVLELHGRFKPVQDVSRPLLQVRRLMDRLYRLEPGDCSTNP